MKGSILRSISLAILLVIIMSVIPLAVPASAARIEPEKPQLNGPYSMKEVLLHLNTPTGTYNDTYFTMTIVIDKDVSEDQVITLYDEFKNSKIELLGKEYPMVFSKLVKDKEGNYLFKVIGPLSRISELVKANSVIVKDVFGKPLLTLNQYRLLDRVADERITDGTKPGSIPEPDTFVVRDIIGASLVEAVYGYNGSGIKIAIVDTGVDYGHPDLRNKLTYYTESGIREPLVLDADEMHVALLQSVTPNASGYLEVNGTTFVVLEPFEWEVNATKDYYVGDVPSLSGVYKFGMTDIYVPAYGGWLNLGMVMTDPVTAGNYTTLYIDANDNGYFTDPEDIVVTYDGDRILVSGDINFPDLSLGVAGGFFYDLSGYFDFGVHPGWDLNGTYISIFYDFYGHGTACASAAAGEGKLDPYLGIGVAPGAKIVGVKALWMGNVEGGMLWAAGFDLESGYGPVTYSGEKRADIISNSWGISTFIYDIAGFGYDFESMFINGLMTPGFLDPNFPGILVVQAAGNGGGGYGTVTTPGTAVNALTVGASTSTHVYLPYGFYSFDYDQIVSWSARGPTPSGLVKPDVVNVGAWGYTAYPVGYYYGIFGGTSYATPLTAGAAALLLQAIKDVLGPAAESIDPRGVKALIKETADNLGYAAFEQGAGRVNIYRAVSLFLKTYAGIPTDSSDIMIYSQSPYTESMNKLEPLWYWMWRDYIPMYFYYYLGSWLEVPDYEIPANFGRANDYGIYIPDIPQGGRKYFNVTLYNPNDEAVTLNMEVVRVERSAIPRRMTVYVTTDEGYGYQYIFLSPNQIPRDSDILVVDAVLPYTFFDQDDDYYSDYEVDVIAYIWVNDTNLNGYPDVDERVVLNFGYSSSNHNFVEIPDPKALIEKWGPEAKLAIRIGIYVANYYTYGDVTDQPVQVTFSYYRFARDPWGWIYTGSRRRPATLEPYTEKTFLGWISVPTYAAPTAYQDYLKVTVNPGEPDEHTYLVPLSYTVYTTLTAGQYKQINKGLWFKTLYSYDTIKGHNDWSWRYEAGDWRVFYVKVDDPRLWAFEYTAKWTDPYTSLITYTLGPDGQFAGLYYGMGASYHYYLGSGTFLWFDTGAIRYENTKSLVSFPTTTYRDGLYPTPKPNLGIYTFIVRTALYGGSSTEEQFKLYVKGIRGVRMFPTDAQPADGSAIIRFAIPHPVDSVEAYIEYPWFPWFTYQGLCRYAEVTPENYTDGPYRAGKIFEFLLTWWNACCGDDWCLISRDDISLVFAVNMTSIPVYYRYGGVFYQYTTVYPFEDWVITGLEDYDTVYWWGPA